MYASTLALAHAWGIDARNAGLSRDTLAEDREAIRAIRDAAYDAGLGDAAYSDNDSTIAASWAQGYDFAPAIADAAEEALEQAETESVTPADVIAYMRSWAPEYAAHAVEVEAESPALAASIRAVLSALAIVPSNLPDYDLMVTRGGNPIAYLRPARRLGYTQLDDNGKANGYHRTLTIHLTAEFTDAEIYAALRWL